MKKKWWIGLCIIGIVVLFSSGMKVKQHMGQSKFHDEMIKVVKSDEAKKIYEKGLRNLDPKALTPQGVIKSYAIDYDSVKHNPMGGIMVNLKINHDPKLNVDVTLDKDTGHLEEGGGGVSEKLWKRLER